jgi:small membrane protein
MIMQLVLTAGLLVCAAYAWNQSRYTRFFHYFLVITAGLGIYFIWWPEQTTALAHGVGIGRGTDLVLYVWLIASLLVSINLHLRLKREQRRITTLAREIALVQPREPQQQ